jgi:CRISPR-associated endonuclease Csy4
MKHYLEITLLPNNELNLLNLWSGVFQQIHLGLVEMQDAENSVPIGLSLPEYKMGERFGILGGKLRLFAPDEPALARFDAVKWLSRLSDYVHCTRIRTVPEKLAGHATYKRVQPKTNPQRLARRYAKRHNLDLDSALNGTVTLRAEGGAGHPTAFRYCDMPKPELGLPYIRLKSLSGGQSFCLWIEKTAAAQPKAGGFSCYGLSAAATVPEF